MKKILSFLMLLTAFAVVSCEETTTTPNVEEDGFVTAVQFIATCPEDGSLRWSETDEISVCVFDTEINANQCFSSGSYGTSAQFSGNLVSWTGTKDLVALYPYVFGGYEVNETEGTVAVDFSLQQIEAGGLDSKGLMVGGALNPAKCVSEDNYSISEVQFYSASSIFSLELTGISANETIQEIYLEANKDVFTVAGDVSLLSDCGEVVYGTETMASTVGGVVLNGSGTTTLQLDIEMLPSYASENTLTLRVVGSYNTYTMKYSDGFDFKRGATVSVSQNLAEDFTAESSGSAECTLADISADNIPESNTWVIIDSEAKTSDFYGVREALNALSGTDRTISIELPNLEFLPHAALMQWYEVGDGYDPYVQPEPDMVQGSNASTRARIIEEAQRVAGDMESFATYDGYILDAMVSISAPKATGLGDNSLWRCYGLQSVSFATATTSGYGSLRFCSALTDVYMPELTYVSDNMFTYCTALKIIDLPKARFIGTCGFNFCSALEEVSMESLTNVGLLGFKDCTVLRTVELPSLKVIQFAGFNKCPKLEDFPMDELLIVEDDSFSYCTSLTSVTMPKVTVLGIDIFLACSKLEEVSFPEVDTVGFRLFGACVSLKKASLPKVRMVSQSMFDTCYSLEEFSAENAAYIGDYAFYDCAKLVSVDLPAVTYIEEYAFGRCDILTELSFPLVESVGEYVFAESELLSRVSLPSVRELGSSAFSLCLSLSELELATGSGVVIEALGYSVFDSYGTSLSPNVALSLGIANASLVSGTTLTVEGVPYTFKSISYK